MKPSGIGGQAVIEGVMMKNKEEYAVAVRKPNKEIVVEKNTYVSASKKYKLFKLPIFRGMLAFAESMIIGTRTLTFSASFFEEEEEVKQTKIDKAFSKVFKDKAESILMGITFFIAILLAVGIFIVIPAFAAGLLGKQIESETILAIVEGCIRILIFVTYILAISQMNDIKRMFMYHGAEHKTINCLEQGFELTVENVKWQSRQHKRCGTSFMFIVMFVSIIFFIFIRVDNEWLRYLIRILLIPIIAGVSYEFIMLAGKSESIVVHVLSQPGMWLQALTTKEPDDDMIEVAIQSVDAVFDWKGFLDLNNEKSSKNKNSRKKHNEKNTNHKKEAIHAEDNNSQAQKKQSAKKDTNKNNNKNNLNINKNEKTGTHKQKDNTPQKADNKNAKRVTQEYKKAIDEIAAAVPTNEGKTDELPKNVIFEEDDEILKALDHYLDNKEEN